MKIYNYDGETKELLSTSDAAVDPLDNDIYLIPANATTKRPTAAKAGFINCFIKGAWVKTVDNRNKKYYLNHEEVFFNLGDKVTDDMSLEKYTTQEIKAMRLASTITALQELCDNKTQEAKDYINGSVATVEQLARYETKYALAKQYKADGTGDANFTLEATLQGTTVEALTASIITIGDAYTAALNSFNSKIEAFRVKVGALISSGELDKANAAIEAGEDLGVTTADNDIKAIFK